MFLNEVPRFLTLPIYALDLSDSSYKFLRLEESAHGVRVANFGEGILSAGIIRNGEILERDKLVQILKNIFYENKIKFVAISLPDEKGFVRSLKMPTATIKESEIESALGLQLEENIPLPPNEVLFDYSVMGIDNDHFDIVLRAVPRALCETYCSIINEAGAMPVVVDIELGAVVRAVVPKNSTETGMILDWGKNRAGFAVYTKGIVQFSSTTELGSAMLTDAISKHMKVSIDNAEDLKKTKIRIPADSSLIKNDELLQATIPIISVLKEEAEKYMQYWQAHSEKNVRPTKLLLTGGGVQIPGFAEYLSQELGIPVSLANPWVNFSFPPHYIPDLKRNDALRFACAAGISLKAREENVRI